LKVVGFDPSLRNWGIASGSYDTVTQHIDIDTLAVISPVVIANKQTRVSSKDLSSAVQLSKAAIEAAQAADIIFVEVPHGSQSARAMAGYGVCIGILGTLRSGGIQFFELSEREVKLAALGKPKVTKLEMIEWATKQWPAAPWPLKTVKGTTSIIESVAEHMADACATVNAGIASDAFKQLMQLQPKKVTQ
jgi:hypothetical protein